MTAGLRPAVFLDRDGVLNESVVIDGVPHPPSGPDAVRISTRVTEACRELRSAGLLLICVTNQPDIARGTLSAETVEATNQEVQRQLALDALLVCPHDDADACDCRKPLPGLLLRASDMLKVDLSRSVMVGDRWRDIEAGRRAGCATIFVDSGYAEPAPHGPDAVVKGLAEAVPYILRMTGNGVAARTKTPIVDVNSLRIEIFADGADLDGIVELAARPWIKGLTTNPTLMRAAGVREYEAFARDVVAAVPDMPISFEVIADDFHEMERQALRLAQWGDNVYVKIPVTDTKRTASDPVIRSLALAGVKLNITALFTQDQVRAVSELLADGPPAFLSVFAGRIADSGRDPIPIMSDCMRIMAPHFNQRLIWASPREVLNIIQADEIGCHVITVTHDLLKKLSNLGKDLDDFSLETVQMFHRDAAMAGFSL